MFAQAIRSTPELLRGWLSRPAIRHHFKPQSTGNRRYFKKLHFHLVTELEFFPCALACERMLNIGINKVIRAKTGNRHKTIRPSIIQFDKQPGTHHAARTE